MLGIKKIAGAIALAGGMAMLVLGNDNGPVPTTVTRTFSNPLGGDPFTYVTTMTGSATALVSVGSDDSISTVNGNHGPPVVHKSVTLPPGVYVTTIPANHAPPGIYTRTSSILPTKTVTTTNTVRSTVTIFGTADTVTVQISAVTSKPSLVTGLCHWSQKDLEVPCTYTTNVTNVSGTGVLTTTASNFGFSTRSNPFKPLVNSVKAMIRRQEPQLLADQEWMRRHGHNITRSGNAAVRGLHNPFKVVVDGVKALVVRENKDMTYVLWALSHKNATENEASAHRNGWTNEVHYAKCDRVPVIWSPMVISIFYILHAIWVKYTWGAALRQASRAHQVTIFIILWGIVFPSFVYIEIFTVITRAWHSCMPDPNRTYAY